MPDLASVPSVTKCDRCARGTVIPDLLKPVYFSRWFIRTAALLCPHCARRQEYVTLAKSLLLRTISTPFFFGLILFHEPRTSPPNSFNDVLLLIPLFLFVQAVMVILHEAAHALVGSLLGLHFFGVSLGSGPVIWNWRLYDRSLEMRLLPIGGFCNVAPDAAHAQRWRVALMVAAGPFVHALALLFCYYTTPKSFLTAPQWPWDAWWVTFAWVNVTMLFSNLTSRHFQRDGRTHMTDGARLRQLWRSKLLADEWIFYHQAKEVELCVQTGRFNEAQLAVEAGFRNTANSPAVRIAEFSLLGAQGRWEEVRLRADAWLTEVDLSIQREAPAAWAAVARVYTNGDLAEAEALCDETMSAIPWDPAAQTVRAVILLAQGRDAEAKTFLTTAPKYLMNHATQAAAARAWAEFWARSGNQKKHALWESRASRLDPIGAFKIPKNAASKQLSPASRNRWPRQYP